MSDYKQTALDTIEKLFKACEGDLSTYHDMLVASFKDMPDAQPTQPNASNALNALDCISRQAAIDVLGIGEELLSRVLDDTDVVGNEREKYEWGLGLIESYIADLNDLPSAQSYTDEEIQKIQELEQAEIEKAFQLGREDALSEIIRCKDCIHGSPMRIGYATDGRGEKMSDLISREAALRTDYFGDGHEGLRAFHSYHDYRLMREYLESLPSAQPEPSQVARDIATIIENEQDMRVLLSQPERKKGKWIVSHIPGSMLWECNRCGFDCGAHSFNFCPNCGADMRGDNNEID